MATDARSKPQLYLVRHGETQWSLSGQHTGRTDISLTAHGRAEAHRVGTMLAGRSFDLVLTSPLERARETAQLAGYGEVARVAKSLREWDYGDYEGRSTDEIRREVPGWVIWEGPVPGGESLEEVGARADRVIRECREAGGDVLLFAHGHILRILTARWCGLGPIEGRRFLLETATLTVLDWEHDYTGVRFFNERGASRSESVPAADPGQPRRPDPA